MISGAQLRPGRLSIAYVSKLGGVRQSSVVGTRLLTCPIHAALANGMLAHADVRFDHPVTPPAQIILRSKLTRTIASLHRFDVSASVNGVVVASGSITLHRGPGGGA